MARARQVGWNAASLFMLVALCSAFTPPAGPRLVTNANTVVYGDYSVMQNLLKGMQVSTPASLSSFDGSDWTALGVEADSIRAVTVASNGDIYFGGTFTFLGAMPCGRVAVYSPTKGGASCLDGGLNGRVSSLTWSSGKLWIGGAFTGALGRSYVEDKSLNHIAIWDGFFKSAPYSGLNDDVDVVGSDATGRVYVAGAFTESADDSDDANPMRAHSARNITSTSTSAMSPPPSVLLTARETDTNVAWFGLEHQSASLTVDLGYSLTLSAITLRNTRLQGRGANDFQITCDTVQTVQYWDAYTRTMTSSSTPRLARLDPVESQTFYFSGSPTCRNLNINFIDYYGEGVGVSYLKVHTRGIIVDETYNAGSASVTPSGRWELTGSSSDTMGEHLRLYVDNESTTVVIRPDIKVPGTFTVRLLFSTCTNCVGEFFATVSRGSSFDDSEFIILPATQNVATLYLTPVTTVTLRLPKAGELNAMLNQTVDFVGAQFRRSASVTSLNSVVWYDAANPTAVNSLSQPLPTGSEIRTMAFNHPHVYFGGLFTRSASEDSVIAHNIIRYTNGALYPFSAYGLNGAVNTISVADANTLVVGGEFTAVSNGTLSLKYVAIYDGEWHPVENGVDDVVYASAAIDGSVLIAGDFSHYFVSNDMFFVSAAHLARIDMSSRTFASAGALSTPNPELIQLAKAPNGNIIMAAASQDIKSVSGNSVSSFDTDDQFSSLDGGFDSDRHDFIMGFKPVVYTAAIGDDGTTYVGGRFKTQGVDMQALNNIAKYDSVNGWSPLAGGLIDGSVLTLRFVDGVLFAGGSFSKSWDAFAERLPVTLTGLASWDGTAWTAPFPQLSPGAVVNAIASVRSESTTYIFVAGTFHSAGSVACSNICMWDGAKWVALGLGISSTGGTPSVNDVLIMNDKVFVGGRFNRAGGIVVSNFAVWEYKSGTWRGISGVPGEITSFATVPGGSDETQIYFNGLFGGFIAKYDGTSVSNIGGDLPATSDVKRVFLWPADNIPEHQTLALPSGHVLLVVGSGLTFNGRSTSMVIFDGANWRPVASTSLPGALTDSGTIYGLVAPQTMLLGASSAKLDSWKIGVIAASGAVFIILIVILIIWLVRRKRKFT